LSNFASLSISEPLSEAELSALRAEVDHAPTPGVSVSTGHSVGLYSDGTIEDNGFRSASISAPPPPGHIRIGGTITSIEAALAAGLIDAADIPSLGKNGDVVEQRHAQALAQRSADRHIAATGNQDADDPNPLDAGTTAAVDAATNILTGFAQMYGVDAVEGGLAASIISGEVPENLPEGMTAAQARTVHAGYVASANHTLREVGSSVGTLTEMLNDQELETVRRSVVYGDTAGVKHYGQLAQDRLARMPETNPEAFAELMAGLPREQRPVKSSIGGYYLRLDNGTEIGWATAVRQGRVRF